jgi:hypothetical protein
VQAAPDPEVQKLLKRQDEELARLKSKMPSPKKRALQLSNDLLRFLDEQMKTQPQLPMPHAGMTMEELTKQRDGYSALYIQWMNQTSSEERNRFALRMAEVFQDMQDEKIDGNATSSMCQFFNGNTFGIQECATSIGVLAQKLSH